jgi:enoyl-CoA hydratase
MPEQDLLLVHQEDGICTLTINRPQKRNILTRETFTRLGDALRSAGEDSKTRVVVLRGAGEKAFSAGYDISRLSISEVADDKDPMEDLMLAVERCAVPVIAMIYGYCIGAGCGLAVACDLRLAAADARLGITAAKIGVVYPPSATLRLLNLVGVAAAKELLYTGRLVDAGRAREIGLVDRVVPADRLAAVTYGLAREIADNSPLSVRGSKTIISRLLDYRSLNSQVREEFLALQKQAEDSRDFEEGAKAFSEKRKPVFRGE